MAMDPQVGSSSSARDHARSTSRATRGAPLDSRPSPARRASAAPAPRPRLSLATSRRASRATAGPSGLGPPEAGPAARSGGVLPAMRYTRLVAQEYEITEPLAVRTMSTADDQKPMTLCQLKSRALPRACQSNTATVRSRVPVHVRGHQRKTPLMASPRNARLLAPVMARPRARPSPEIAM